MPAVAPNSTIRLLHLITVTGAVCLFVGGLSWFSLSRLSTFLIDSRDLAIFAQSIGSLTRGKPLLNSFELHGLEIAGGQEVARAKAETQGGISHFGVHWSPILLTLGPLYALAPDPLTLQVVQALLIGLGAVAIFYLASDWLGGPWWPLIFALLFLWQPLTIMMGTETFRENAFLAPTLPLLVLAITRKRTVAFVAALLPVLLIKEEVCALVCLMGLGWALNAQTRRRGLLAAGAGFTTLVLGLALIYWCRDGVESDHVRRYAPRGSTMADVVLQWVMHPLATLRIIQSRLTADYVLYLLGPWGFLPLLSPYALLAVPIVALNLLSALPYQWDAFSYSSLVLVPVLAIAALDGFARLRRWRVTSPGFAAQGIAPYVGHAVLFASVVLAGVVNVRAYGWLDKALVPRLTEGEQKAAWHLISTIPKDATVLASPDFLPALSNHTRVFVPRDVLGVTPDHLLLFEDTRFIWPWSSTEEHRDFVARVVEQHAMTGQRFGRVFSFSRQRKRDTPGSTSMASPSPNHRP